MTLRQEREPARGAAKVAVSVGHRLMVTMKEGKTHETVGSG
jgi:hypothetical protein